MLITTLHINLTSYVLHEEVDSRALAADIEAAVRAGGAFVAVRTADAVERSVLITPGLLVEIEPIETNDAREQDALEASHDGATFAGLDLYTPAHPTYFSW